MRAVALVLLLLAAGCVTPSADLDPASAARLPADVASRLSPILGELEIVHSVVDVETRHGLANVDLYVPTTPNGEKVPVILVASPYNNEYGALNMQSGDGKKGDDNWVSRQVYEWMRDDLMMRGYALAQMDILGTRNSGGCQGIMNEAERQSTADVVDWLGTQEWSSGKVGMIGKSYLGMSQIGAAVEAPEHLATIVPISPPTHDYAYHYYNGVPYALNHATNFLYYGAFGLAPPDGDLATYGPRYVERLPCAPEALAASFSTMGDYTERWQERDYRPLIANMDPDVAVFFIAGHQDWNVKPDHPIEVFNAFPGPKLGMFGQWAHDYPEINTWDEDAYGERHDWYYMLHRWFDHHLKGIDTGIMDEAAVCPVQTQDYAGTWRCADAFPSLLATALTLYPQGDGTLADAPGDGSATFSDVEGDLLGPGDTEQASFSFPIEQTTRIFGAPEVTLNVATTSAYNAHVHAALGVVRESRLDEVTWGFQSLRHRESLEAARPIAPGEAYDITFRLYPVDLVLEPGDELVLIVRGANGELANVLMLPNPQPGVITLALGETTMLTLPTMALDGAFAPLAGEELPENYRPKE